MSPPKSSKGVRVLVTGMGGELGSRVAALLEADPRVGDLMGFDVEPPRRRLRRATFHRVDPRDRRKVAPLVRDFAPEVVVHAGVYEPNARAGPRLARERTEAGTVVALGAAAEGGAMQRLVVRSGIEVYGRRKGAPSVPDESLPPAPSSGFGRTLLEVERVAAATAAAAGVAVTSARLAPVVGPHVPSPLGRYLRMRVVPVWALADPPFALLHQEDAAAALVWLALRDEPYDGAVNLVGAGAVTPVQAARLGSRIPIPVFGPGWLLATRAADVMGVPVPDHVVELLRRGRCADGALAAALGAPSVRSTRDVVEALFEWAPVAPLRVVEDAA